MQRSYGSPERDGGHEQMPRWLTTEQTALSPHSPGHGSTHCFLTHERTAGQSELMTHSGRQFGGAPR